MPDNEKGPAAADRKGLSLYYWNFPIVQKPSELKCSLRQQEALRSPDVQVAPLGRHLQQALEDR